ncbi:MAG: hypothetical protein HY700_11170 [Gemmatimonadetes bacterium]|nr:hypothetical protein [Gemmatimonadota bacterium]
MNKALLAGTLAAAVTAYSGVLQAQNYGAEQGTTRTLSQGTMVSATLEEPISTRTNKIGDTLPATVNSDVRDANGQVIFPVGAVAQVKIIDLKPADREDKNGALALAVTEVRAGGQTYHLNTPVDSLAPETLKPGWTSDKTKIGIGAAAGAVVGGLLGGNLKSAVIGGILGGAGGAVVAHEMNGRDIVVKSGTNVTFKIEQPVQVMVSMR